MSARKNFTAKRHENFSAASLVVDNLTTVAVLDKRPNPILRVIAKEDQLNLGRISKFSASN